MNLNKVFLIGRVTKDPVKRALPSGSSVVNFGIATNHTYKKNEEKVEQVEFHNIIAFGKLADIISQYIVKGQLLMVEGRIKTNSWEKDGVKHQRTEIIMEGMQMGPKANSPAKEEPLTNQYTDNF